MRYLIAYTLDGQLHELRRSSLKAAQAAVLDLKAARPRKLTITDTDKGATYSGSEFLRVGARSKKR